MHRLGQELALHYPPLFGTANQPGVLEHAQVFHEACQRHAMGLRKLRNWQAAFAQGFQHGSARWIGKRTEHGIETMLMLNHKVHYGDGEILLSSK